MLRIRRRLCLVACLLVIVDALLAGQSDRDRPARGVAPSLASSRSLAEFPAATASPLPLGPAAPIGPITLPHMIRAAGAIFAGTVTAIARAPATTRDAIATVAITFRVNQGIRGAISGQDFTIHQWMGLWNSGQQRYRVGEQVLLFLYPASKLGLTSWVAGSLGHFTIDRQGRVQFSPQHVLAFRTDPVLGGKPSASIGDFAWAVRRASEGEVVASRP